MTTKRMEFYSDRRYTQLTHLLNCELPILCAGMGGVSRFELTAAVSNAGGFGVLGMVRESDSFMQDQIQATRSMTGRPFGVNIIPSATNHLLLKKQVAMLIRMQVPVVVLFWDVVPWVVHELLEAGIVLLYQVGSIQEAKTVLEMGVHGVIAQGVGAGGHVRGVKATEGLVRNLSKITQKPIIAAGGISTGKDMITMLDCGAHGICCGTAFLATHESFAHEFHKKRVLDSAEQDTVLTKIFHINWPPGAPVRVIKNSVIENGCQKPGEQRSVIAYDANQPLYLHSTDSPLRTTQGDLEKMALYAGTSCTNITEICSAAERVNGLLDQAADWQEKKKSSGPGYNLDELYLLLSDLLAAERAGAKVCRAIMRQAATDDAAQFIESIRRDEVKYCDRLIQCLEHLNLRPHTMTGDFYDKCMAIKDYKERLAFLNKGQEWVVLQLNRSLPLITDTYVFDILSEMLQTHEQNIDRTMKRLAGIELKRNNLLPS